MIFNFVAFNIFKELFLIDKDIIIFDLINNGNKNYAVLVAFIVKKLFKNNTRNKIKQNYKNNY